jgi:general secretion pathway protein I
LLAITFTALMQVAGGSMRLSQNAAAHSEAALLARSMLDSSFVVDPIRPGDSEGHFDNRYRWHLQVTPWSAPGVVNAVGALSMYRIDLDVLWGSAPFEHHAHFVTLRAARAAQGSTPP